MAATETELRQRLREVFRDVGRFAEVGAGVRLRDYQLPVAEAIVDSVRHRRGHTIVVAMSRQSGKNETQAHVETFLLAMGLARGGEMVKASPSFKPQTENAMRRLERALSRNRFTAGLWRKRGGYVYGVGQAAIYFFSGFRDSSVVGATASLLLECDEAQDVLTAKWDKDFAPMAASTNATRVFWGTEWTNDTLLAREMDAALEAEKHDGIRRVFRVTADEVAREVPEYGAYVAGEVAKLGRYHPLIKTQYFLERIDAAGRMFTAERRALMRGEHDALEAPVAGERYVALLDVAGEDEDASFDRLRMLSDVREARRDSTALTMVRVVAPKGGATGAGIPSAATYEVVRRWQWTGVKHTLLHGRIKALCDLWRVRSLVADATGVGAGLVSFLGAAMPGRVVPFVFTAKSKSELGYGFLGVVDTGRFKDYSEQSRVDSEQLRGRFERELMACDYAIKPGPGKVMAWGVPDGARDPLTGELLHDDLVLSAALCAVLDGVPWQAEGKAVYTPARDPL